MKALLLIVLFGLAGCSTVPYEPRVYYRAELFWPYGSIHFYEDPFYPVYPRHGLRAVPFYHWPPHHRIPRYHP